MDPTTSIILLLFLVYVIYLFFNPPSSPWDKNIKYT